MTGQVSTTGHDARHARYLANRERVLQQTREWKAAHPEAVAEQKRRARERQRAIAKAPKPLEVPSWA